MNVPGGSGGLDRPITSPYVQKTGLALVVQHAARALADRLERQLQLTSLDALDESEIDERTDPGEDS